MKTVLLCGGFGTRIRDVADDIPKPLIKVGAMPILWHLLGYYASFDFCNFVLCLGYKSETVVDFFRSQDGELKLITSETNELTSYEYAGLINGKKCSVTLVDTGLDAMTGARLRKVQKFIGNETFMLSYGDGLSDVNLNELVKHHQNQKKLLTVTGVRPPSRFGELASPASTKNHRLLVDEFLVGFLFVNLKFLNILDQTTILYLKKNQFKRLCTIRR